MTIHIEALTFKCIIGILDFERLNEQQVIIDMELSYPYVDDDFINYADVILLIERDMTNNKYELLETALNEIEKKLISTYPNIKEFTLKITKPNIINNAKVALSKKFSNQ
jgi:dihydroneopterin aldolase